MIPAKRYCLVTGAAGGIGSALVDIFADAGYGVIAIDLMKEIKGLRCLHYIQADLNLLADDCEYADQIMLRVRGFLGDRPLAALINNAAIQVMAPTALLNRNEWKKTLNVNLLAPFFLAQGFLDELMISKGVVVNISSIHAQHTKADFVAYSTSKAAISGLTRAMAVDLRGAVRVVCIEPAAIETQMLKDGFKGRDGDYKKLNELHPIGRIGKPDEVARLALMIVDGGINFLNGVSIRLDGGISARLMDPEY